MAGSLPSTIPNPVRRRQAAARENETTLEVNCYTNIRMRPSGERASVRRGAAWTVITLLTLASALGAQEANKPVTSPSELVRATVQNEVAASDHTSIKHMFCSHKTGSRQAQTHIYVETTQSMAGMLVATDGHPLTPEQREAEFNRLNGLATSPDALRRKRAHEKDDADHTLRILKALPDAFRYEYDGAVAGTAETGGAGAHLVRLRFTPNPSYAAPSRIEQVLSGMQGYLLIDADQHRIAEMDGKLFKDVSFGWGIIGRLNKGGRFRVEQADVGDGAWEITEMNLNISGKVLIFKSLNLSTKEVFSDFQRVPNNTTFAQGVELLKTVEQKIAKGGPPTLDKKAE
jgi:hypothetical protein